MTNIDLCGIAQLLRTLIEQKKTTEREARKKRGPQNFGQNCRTDRCGHYPFFLKSHSFQ